MARLLTNFPQSKWRSYFYQCISVSWSGKLQFINEIIVNNETHELKVWNTLCILHILHLARSEMGNVTFLVDVTVTRYIKKTHGRYRHSFFFNITLTLPLLVTVASLLFSLLVTILKCNTFIIYFSFSVNTMSL